MRDEVGRWPHVRGTLGISTRGRDTGDGQIFIDLVDNPRYDHTYTVFAQVLNGMEIVDRLMEETSSTRSRSCRELFPTDACGHAGQLPLGCTRQRASRGTHLARSHRVESDTCRIRLPRRSARATPLIRAVFSTVLTHWVRWSREAVAADFARRGTSVRPEHVMLTVSTSDAYSVLFKLLCDPGDEVLIPQPSYPLFEHLTRLDSIVSVPYRLEYHGQWSIDVASVEAAMSSRTRAVLLVNPNNPTGSFVSTAEVDRLACALRGARRCHHLGRSVRRLRLQRLFADQRRPARRAIGRARLHHGRSVEIGGTAAGEARVDGRQWARRSVAAAMLRLELICDTYLSVSTPVQLALPELLARGAVIREQIQARVERNLHPHCSRLVTEWPSCSLLRADGGWSAVIRVPRLMPEEELVLNLLNEQGVLVHPGYFFDFAEESCVIVSLLVLSPCSSMVSRACCARVEARVDEPAGATLRRDDSAVLGAIDGQLGMRRDW